MADCIVPEGFKFLPTEQQLITLFLQRKVNGLQISPVYPIIDRPLYGENATPWDVIKDDDPWEDSEFPNKKTITVFSRLIFVNDNTRNRVVRTAGCGTWDGKAKTQYVKNYRGEVIGHKRSFTFKPLKEYESSMKGKGRWIMHEYSLLPARGNDQNVNADLVICRISRDFPKEKVLNSDDSQTTTDQVPSTDHSSTSTATAETSRKRKSSSVSYDQDDVRQKKACVSVEEHMNQEIMSYSVLPTVNHETVNQDVIPYVATWSNGLPEIYNLWNDLEPLQQIPNPYSSQSQFLAPSPWDNASLLDIINIGDWKFDVSGPSADFLGYFDNR